MISRQSAVGSRQSSVDGPQRAGDGGKRNKFDIAIEECEVGIFNKFEDIKAWQRARELTRLVYETTAKDDFKKDHGLRDQIRRACVSIMANIAEGHGRLSDKEFANFLNIARGSAMEVKSHLYVALDLNLITQDKFDNLYAGLDETAKMIFGLIRHLKQIK